MPAAPEPFLLLFFCLRRTMRYCQPFTLEKTEIVRLGTPYLYCTGLKTRMPHGLVSRAGPAAQSPEAKKRSKNGDFGPICAKYRPKIAHFSLFLFTYSLIERFFMLFIPCRLREVLNILSRPKW
jgi:hypothetical protein